MAPGSQRRVRGCKLELSKSNSNLAECSAHLLAWITSQMVRMAWNFVAQPRSDFGIGSLLTQRPVFNT